MLVSQTVRSSSFLRFSSCERAAAMEASMAFICPVRRCSSSMSSVSGTDSPSLPSTALQDALLTQVLHARGEVMRLQSLSLAAPRPAKAHLHVT